MTLNVIKRAVPVLALMLAVGASACHRYERPAPTVSRAPALWKGYNSNKGITDAKCSIISDCILS